MADATPLLEVADIETCYGLSQVLFGLSLQVRTGEMVTLMGRNGMGKTTTIRSIMGLTPARAGTIRFGGREVRKLASFRIAQLGIGLVPEGRQIFPNLTVRENLVAASGNRLGSPDPWTIEKIHALFPRLAERGSNMGVTLSGGEQQMLAIGRALMTNPRLLILDEATEGLAPLIRDEIWNCLSMLKARGQSVLVIDKNVENLTRIADRHYIIERGRAVWSGTSEAIDCRARSTASISWNLSAGRLRPYVAAHRRICKMCRAGYSITDAGRHTELLFALVLGIDPQIRSEYCFSNRHFAQSILNSLFHRRNTLLFLIMEYVFCRTAHK